MAKFVLLAGLHSDSEDEQGSPIVHKVGDIITTDKDLTKHNSPGSEKYRRLPDDAPTETATVDLDVMTVAQLRAYAEQEEIELEPALRKDEMLSIIRNALAEA